MSISISLSLGRHSASCLYSSDGWWLGPPGNSSHLRTLEVNLQHMSMQDNSKTLTATTNLKRQKWCLGTGLSRSMAQV